MSHHTAGSSVAPSPSRLGGRRRIALLAVPLLVLAGVGAALVAGRGASASKATRPSSEVSLWSATAKPAMPVDPDQDPVEIGTRFTAAVAGSVTGLRFFRYPSNAGPHVGHLWNDRGALLATVAFGAETGSGWQLALLATPVALEPGRSYVVSYHAPAGQYADDQLFFERQRLRSGPLTADAGVYAYGQRSHYPTLQWHSSAYFADVTFQPSGAAAPPPADPTVGPISPTATPTTAPTTTTAAPTSTAASPTTSATAPPTPTTPAPPAAPGSCVYPTCFPTAANTGVPAGTALTTVNGDLTVTKAGTTVDAKDIRGDLIVQADNVTVTRTRIEGTVFAHTSDQSGLLLQDSEITSSPGRAFSVGNQPPIADGNYTLRRVHVHRWQDGPRSGSGPMVIEDSLVDELAFAAGEHPDAFQLYGPGSRVSVVLRHSTFSGCAGNSSDKGSSAMFWSDHPGAGSTLVVTESRFACGQYSIRINDANAGSRVVADVHDNVVVKGSYADGPVECTNSVLFNGTEGIKWANNSFDSGGAIKLSGC